MQGGMGHALDEPVERFVTDGKGAIVRLARGVADPRHPGTGAPVRPTASAAEAGSRSVPVVTATPSTEPVPEPAPAQEPPRPLEELLAELEGLVGLAEVKAEVRTVANLITVQNL